VALIMNFIRAYFFLPPPNYLSYIKKYYSLSVLPISKVYLEYQEAMPYKMVLLVFQILNTSVC